MRTRLCLALVGVLLAAAPAASSIGVTVQVGASGPRWEPGIWVEFQPERSAYVALYATFSDGTLMRVFPTRHCSSHWVSGWDTRFVRIRTPRGACLESVQAVASDDWFDPYGHWAVTARAWRPLPPGFWVTLSAGPSFVYPTHGWGARYARSCPPRTVVHPLPLSLTRTKTPAARRGGIVVKSGNTGRGSGHYRKEVSGSGRKAAVPGARKVKVKRPRVQTAGRTVAVTSSRRAGGGSPTPKRKAGPR